MNKQAGFTLIELAIVLVIIGLLLGGVLKGQELINSARVKNMASDFRNVQVFIYGYQDRFRAVPGDDAAVDAHLGAACVPSCAAASPAGLQGNGVIDGAWDTLTGGDETCVFWQHVRLANLAPGTSVVDCANAGSTYVARNASGGRFGVQSVGAAGNFVTIVDPVPMTGSYVACSQGIQGNFATQLDTLLDDGETSTGSVRAVVNSGDASPTSADITLNNPSTPMIVCMVF